MTTTDAGIYELLDEYRIPVAQKKHEHYRYGWVQLCCPYCGDGNFHLGYNISKNYFTCYRCGWHALVETVALVCNVKYAEARMLAKRYRLGSAIGADKDDETIAKNPFKIPSSGDILKARGPYCYLRERFANLTQGAFKGMVRAKGITYTGLDYNVREWAARIVFPAYYEGLAVSFQGRSFAPLSKAKYRTAEPENERVHHKTFLWGIDGVPYNTVIVCEGVMDALSIGDGAVHTHGVEWTKEQARMLALFDKVYICYDNEDIAYKKAAKLKAEICHRTNAHIVKLSAHDVNSCSQDELAELKGLLNA